MRYVFVSNAAIYNDGDDGTRLFSSSPKPGHTPPRDVTEFPIDCLAILVESQDKTGFDFTSAPSGWVSAEALIPIGLNEAEIDLICNAGLSPIEREIVKIDGVIQPSLMVRCQEGRVRLDPKEMVVGHLLKDNE